MKKLSLAALVLGAVTGPVQGQSFEVFTHYADSESDSASAGVADSQTSLGLIGINYYTEPLDTTEGPLALASFYGQNTHISLSHARGEYDSSNSSSDLDATAISTRWVNRKSGWLGSANYRRTTVDTQPQVKQLNYTLAIGKYIAPTSEIALAFNRVEDATNGDSKALRVSNFHAQQIGADQYFDGGVALSYIERERSEDGFQFELASTYYPSRAVGLGLSASFSDAGNEDTLHYGLSAQWFVTPSVALDAHIIHSDTQRSGVDIDTQTLQLGMKVRF
ncbi:MAG: hypothetical protein ACPG4U_16125 [Pseudomonadales bacterium]